MSLFEFNLEKPAFKRVAASDDDGRTDATEDRPSDAETTDREPTEAAASEDSSRRRPGRRAVALLAVAVAVLAIKRRRS